MLEVLIIHRRFLFTFIGRENIKYTESESIIVCAYVCVVVRATGFYYTGHVECRVCKKLMPFMFKLVNLFLKSAQPQLDVVNRVESCTPNSFINSLRP